jgi:hypothetical protein
MNIKQKNIKRDELVDNGYKGTFPKRGYSLRDQVETLAIYRKRGTSWIKACKSAGKAFSIERHLRVIVYNIH